MSSVIDRLKDVLEDSQVLTGEDVTGRAPHIWKPSDKVSALTVLLPSSTEDVQAICRICSEMDQPMVIHGGMTNLVRSTESTSSDVVISLERMNKIYEVDRENKTMTVGAGIVLQNIHQVAEENGMFFPMNFGAKGSCQIGGCINTNAGGLRVLKYGMTRESLLGLEVVRADGTKMSSMHKMKKNNTGYDWKHLVVGSEGTLCIVTKALLRLCEKPVSRNSAYVGFNKYEHVVKFFHLAEKRLGGKLSAFEVFWPETYKALTSNHSPYAPPMKHGYSHYALVEACGGHPEQDTTIFQGLLIHAIESGLAVDSVMAHSESDHNWFWSIREDIGVLLQYFMHRQDFDISLPMSVADKYVRSVIPQLNELRLVGPAFAFGHLGDGNVHFVIGKPDDSPELTHRINEIVYSPLKEFAGSVSAEHGIGLDKKDYMGLTRDPVEIEMMKSFKKVWDPKLLLNRGKIFDI